MRRPDRALNAHVELRQQERAYSRHIQRLNAIQSDIQMQTDITPHIEQYRNTAYTEKINAIQKANHLYSMIGNEKFDSNLLLSPKSPKSKEMNTQEFIAKENATRKKMQKRPPFECELGNLNESGLTSRVFLTQNKPRASPNNSRANSPQKLKIKRANASNESTPNRSEAYTPVRTTKLPKHNTKPNKIAFEYNEAEILVGYDEPIDQPDIKIYSTGSATQGLPVLQANSPSRPKTTPNQRISHDKATEIDPTDQYKKQNESENDGFTMSEIENKRMEKTNNKEDSINQDVLLELPNDNPPEKSGNKELNSNRSNKSRNSPVRQNQIYTPTRTKTSQRKQETFPENNHQNETEVSPHEISEIPDLSQNSDQKSARKSSIKIKNENDSNPSNDLQHPQQKKMDNGSLLTSPQEFYIEESSSISDGEEEEANEPKTPASQKNVITKGYSPLGKKPPIQQLVNKTNDQQPKDQDESSRSFRTDGALASDKIHLDEENDDELHFSTKERFENVLNVLDKANGNNNGNNGPLVKVDEADEEGSAPQSQRSQNEPGSSPQSARSQKKRRRQRVSNDKGVFPTITPDKFDPSNPNDNENEQTPSKQNSARENVDSKQNSARNTTPKDQTPRKNLQKDENIPENADKDNNKPLSEMVADAVDKEKQNNVDDDKSTPRPVKQANNQQNNVNNNATPCKDESQNPLRHSQTPAKPVIPSLAGLLNNNDNNNNEKKQISSARSPKTPNKVPPIIGMGFISNLNNKSPTKEEQVVTEEQQAPISLLSMKKDGINRAISRSSTSIAPISSLSSASSSPAKNLSPEKETQPSTVFDPIMESPHPSPQIPANKQQQKPTDNNQQTSTNNSKPEGSNDNKQPIEKQGATGPLAEILATPSNEKKDENAQPTLFDLFKKPEENTPQNIAKNDTTNQNVAKNDATNQNVAKNDKTNQNPAKVDAQNQNVAKNDTPKQSSAVTAPNATKTEPTLLDLLTGAALPDSKTDDKKPADKQEQGKSPSSKPDEQKLPDNATSPQTNPSDKKPTQQNSENQPKQKEDSVPQNMLSNLLTSVADGNKKEEKPMDRDFENKSSPSNQQSIPNSASDKPASNTAPALTGPIEGAISNNSQQTSEPTKIPHEQQIADQSKQPSQHIDPSKQASPQQQNQPDANKTEAAPNSLTELVNGAVSAPHPQATSYQQQNILDPSKQPADTKQIANDQQINSQQQQPSNDPSKQQIPESTSTAPPLAGLLGNVVNANQQPQTGSPQQPFPQSQVGSPQQQPFPQSQVGSPQQQPFPQSQVGSPQQQSFPQSQVGSPQQQSFPQSQVGSPQQQPFPQPQVGSPQQQSFPQPQTGSPQQQSFPQSQTGSPQQQSFPQSQVGSPQQQSFPQSQTGSPQQQSFPQSQAGSPQQQSFPQSQTGSPQQQSFPQSQAGSPQQQSFPQSQAGSPQQQSFPQPQTGSPQQQLFPQSQVGSPQQQPFPQSQIGSPQPQPFPQSQSQQQNQIDSNKPQSVNGNDAPSLTGLINNAVINSQQQPYPQQITDPSKQPSGLNNSAPTGPINDKQLSPQQQQYTDPSKPYNQENANAAPPMGGAVNASLPQQFGTSPNVADSSNVTNAPHTTGAAPLTAGAVSNNQQSPQPNVDPSKQPQMNNQQQVSQNTSKVPSTAGPLAPLLAGVVNNNQPAAQQQQQYTDPVTQQNATNPSVAGNFDNKQLPQQPSDQSKQQNSPESANNASSVPGAAPLAPLLAGVVNNNQPVSQQQQNVNNQPQFSDPTKQQIPVNTSSAAPLNQQHGSTGSAPISGVVNNNQPYAQQNVDPSKQPQGNNQPVSPENQSGQVTDNSQPINNASPTLPGLITGAVQGQQNPSQSNVAQPHQKAQPAGGSPQVVIGTPQKTFADPAGISEPSQFATVEYSTSASEAQQQSSEKSPKHHRHHHHPSEISQSGEGPAEFASSQHPSDSQHPQPISGAAPSLSQNVVDRNQPQTASDPKQQQQTAENQDKPLSGLLGGIVNPQKSDSQSPSISQGQPTANDKNIASTPNQPMTSQSQQPGQPVISPASGSPQQTPSIAQPGHQPAMNVSQPQSENKPGDKPANKSDNQSNPTTLMDLLTGAVSSPGQPQSQTPSDKSTPEPISHKADTTNDKQHPSTSQPQQISDKSSTSQQIPHQQDTQGDKSSPSASSPQSASSSAPSNSTAVGGPLSSALSPIVNPQQQQQQQPSTTHETQTGKPTVSDSHNHPLTSQPSQQSHKQNEETSKTEDKSLPQAVKEQSNGAQPPVSGKDAPKTDGKSPEASNAAPIAAGAAAVAAPTLTGLIAGAVHNDKQQPPNVSQSAAGPSSTPQQLHQQNADNTSQPTVSGPSSSPSDKQPQVVSPQGQTQQPNEKGAINQSTPQQNSQQQQPVSSQQNPQNVSQPVSSTPGDSSQPQNVTQQPQNSDKPLSSLVGGIVNHQQPSSQQSNTTEQKPTIPGQPADNKNISVPEQQHIQQPGQPAIPPASGSPQQTSSIAQPGHHPEQNVSQSENKPGDKTANKSDNQSNPTTLTGLLAGAVSSPGQPQSQTPTATQQPSDKSTPEQIPHKADTTGDKQHPSASQPQQISDKSSPQSSDKSSTTQQIPHHQDTQGDKSAPSASNPQNASSSAPSNPTAVGGPLSSALSPIVNPQQQQQQQQPSTTHETQPGKPTITDSHNQPLTSQPSQQSHPQNEETSKTDDKSLPHSVKEHSNGAQPPVAGQDAPKSDGKSPETNNAAPIAAGAATVAAPTLTGLIAGAVHNDKQQPPNVSQTAAGPSSTPQQLHQQNADNTSHPAVQNDKQQPPSTHESQPGKPLTTQSQSDSQPKSQSQEPSKPGDKVASAPAGVQSKAQQQIPGKEPAKSDGKSPATNSAAPVVAAGTAGALTGSSPHRISASSSGLLARYSQPHSPEKASHPVSTTLQNLSQQQHADENKPQNIEEKDPNQQNATEQNPDKPLSSLVGGIVNPQHPSSQQNNPTEQKPTIPGQPADNKNVSVPHQQQIQQPDTNSPQNQPIVGQSPSDKPQQVSSPQESSQQKNEKVDSKPSDKDAHQPNEEQQNETPAHKPTSLMAMIRSMSSKTTPEIPKDDEDKPDSKLHYFKPETKNSDAKPGEKSSENKPEAKNEEKPNNVAVIPVILPAPGSAPAADNKSMPQADKSQPKDEQKPTQEGEKALPENETKQPEAKDEAKPGDEAGESAAKGKKHRKKSHKKDQPADETTTVVVLPGEAPPINAKPGQSAAALSSENKQSEASKTSDAKEISTNPEEAKPEEEQKKRRRHHKSKNPEEPETKPEAKPDEKPAETAKQENQKPEAQKQDPQESAKQESQNQESPAASTRSHKKRKHRTPTDQQEPKKEDGEKATVVAGTQQTSDQIKQDEKKPEDKKSDDKKQETIKSDDKKQNEDKSDDKKPEKADEKSPENKKDEQIKPEEKKSDDKKSNEKSGATVAKTITPVTSLRALISNMGKQNHPIESQPSVVPLPEERKTDSVKSDEKKPEGKNSDDKKPEPTKHSDKKSDAKPEEKKPDAKAADNKPDSKTNDKKPESKQEEKKTDKKQDSKPADKGAAVAVVPPVTAISNMAKNSGSSQPEAKPQDKKKTDKTKATPAKQSTKQDQEKLPSLKKDSEKENSSQPLTAQELAQIDAATESVNDKEPPKQKKHRHRKRKEEDPLNNTVVILPSSKDATPTKKSEPIKSEASQEMLDPADDEEPPSTTPQTPLSPKHSKTSESKKVKKSKSAKEPPKTLPALKVQSQSSSIAPKPKFHFSTFVELDAPPTSSFLSQTETNNFSSAFSPAESAMLSSTTGGRSGKKFPLKKSFSSRNRTTAPGSPAYVWTGHVSSDDEDYTPRGEGLITSIRLTRHRFLKSKRVIDQDANLRPSSIIVSPDDDQEDDTDEEIDDNERNQMMAFSGLADLSHVDRIIKNIKSSNNPDDYKSSKPQTKKSKHQSTDEEPVTKSSNCRFVN